MEVPLPEVEDLVIIGNEKVGPKGVRNLYIQQRCHTRHKDTKESNIIWICTTRKKYQCSGSVTTTKDLLLLTSKPHGNACPVTLEQEFNDAVLADRLVAEGPITLKMYRKLKADHPYLPSRSALLKRRRRSRSESVYS